MIFGLWVLLKESTVEVARSSEGLAAEGVFHLSTAAESDQLTATESDSFPFQLHQRLRLGRGRGRGLESVAIAFEGDDFGVVDELVDHGCGDDAR